MRSRLRLVTLLVTAAVALALTSGQAQQSANVESLALQDTAKLRRKGPRAIPNRYIVVLDQDAAGPAGNPAIAAKLTEDVLAGFGRAADRLYSKALNGFSVELTEAEAVAISEDPRVAFVEEDSVMETQITQTNPPWGLDRIGQRSPASQQHLFVHDHGRRRERLRDRHRDSIDAHTVRRARVCRFRCVRRELRRLQRARDPRRGDDWRIDVRCGQERAFVRGSRAEL